MKTSTQQIDFDGESFTYTNKDGTFDLTFALEYYVPSITGGTDD